LYNTLKEKEGKWQRQRRIERRGKTSISNTGGLSAGFLSDRSLRTCSRLSAHFLFYKIAKKRKRNNGVEQIEESRCYLATKHIVRKALDSFHEVVRLLQVVLNVVEVTLDAINLLRLLGDLHKEDREAQRG